MKAVCVRPLGVVCLGLWLTSGVWAQSNAPTRSTRPTAAGGERSAVSAWERIGPRRAEASPVSTGEFAHRASGRVPVGAPVLGMLPGEFERQQAMLLACDPLISSLPDLFVEIVRQLHERVEIVALVGGNKCRLAALELLAEHRIVAPRIHFVNLKHNSMWARDFGPHVVRGLDHRWSLVDSIYTCPDRSADDDVPLALGKSFDMPATRGELRVDGGNLLSNGRGLLIATHELAARNMLPGVSVASVRQRLGELYGAREVLFLEPLLGEPTAHVDMFATFTAPDTVVVGQLDPRADLENSVILDRNAARLASLRSGGRRLRVVRVPMPAHDDAVWRSFTNVVYANGLLLVPTCREFDKAASDTALATYKRLLPHWQVEAVESEALLALGGALHCITMNLGRVERWPLWIDEDPEPMGDAPRRAAPGFETVPLEQGLRLFGTESGIRVP